MELRIISSPDVVTVASAESRKVLLQEIMLLNQLFGAGLEVFHLRKPEMGIADGRAYLREIDPQYHSRITLHQWHELADEFGISRLHYNVMARRELKFNGITNPERKILSTSAHQLNELAGLSAFQYVFFGPVFDSISKPGYKRILAPDFQLPKLQAPLQVIAIGGIDAHNIEAVKDMNFNGAALLGAIWKAPERALEVFNKCLSLC